MDNVPISTTTTTTPEDIADSRVKAIWIFVEWFVIFIKLAFPAFLACSYCQVGFFRGKEYHFMPPLRCPLYALTLVSCMIAVGCLWDSFSTTDFGGYTSMVTGFPSYCPGTNGTMLDITRTNIMELAMILLIGHALLMPIFRCALKRSVGNSYSVLLCWCCTVAWMCAMISMCTYLPEFCDMNEPVVLMTYNACLVMSACTGLGALLRFGHFLSFKCAFRKWECSYFGIDTSFTIVSNMHIEELYSKWANPEPPSQRENFGCSTDIPPDHRYIAMDDGVSSEKGKRFNHEHTSAYRGGKTSYAESAYDDSSETYSTTATSKLSKVPPSRKKPLLSKRVSRKTSFNPFQFKTVTNDTDTITSSRVTNLLDDSGVAVE